ncbi:outer membrane lipoprotein carrier protein LolA [Pontibacter sp. G13]|uniref:LolA family protein n=1 Tax=Pontibacter sp. G13 TaxID=3074898 RepID=UPI00288B5211|nr:outer membrane lipoprotein carrier protein LolA [Pontibacter sp. G13]WNJ20777.1 outer membrane lipoprotein carrier protein LolA [Pontibacter sp. G13]
MKRVILVLPALLLMMWVSPISLHAQNGRDILLKSKAKFESLDDFSANFKYKLSNPALNTQPVEQSGTVQYMKGGSFVLKLDDMQIFCDKQTIWQYNTSTQPREVTIMEYDEEEVLDITEVFKVYEDASEAQVQGSEKIHGQDCFKIYVAVKDPQADYNQAVVWVNKKTMMPEKASLVERTQSMTTFEFSNYELNQDLTVSDFRMDIESEKAELAQQSIELNVYDER